MCKDLLNKRIYDTQQEMKKNGLEALIIGSSADFSYYFGKHPRPTERFLAIIIPLKGKASLIVPSLDVKNYITYKEEVNIIDWEDSENPIDILVDLLREGDINVIGTNNDLWSVFVYRIKNQNPELVVTEGSSIIARLRLLKTESEINALQKAAEKIDEVWNEFILNTSHIVGKTENQIRAYIMRLMFERGFEEVAWCDVGSGPNSATPLHVGSERKIQKRDPIVIDFAGKYQGYCADTCRTIVAKEPEPEFVKIYELVKNAQKSVTENVREGITCSKLDSIARDIISGENYEEYFIHRTGHGIGLDYHEDPYIVKGNNLKLQTGMVFSNEPGIYIPNLWGVRIEDIIALSQSGIKVLNNTNRELVALP
ncbi:M24 family metallopeptidase [Pseudogracilibacillus sp. SO30301A]|uniref:M24 family metallopeptidase n=1 Tax=Pseudogracilibacillus sp. SO30301A TaxID=3098291 RepID=UPI00300E50A8